MIREIWKSMPIEEKIMGVIVAVLAPVFLAAIATVIP